jgi:hypothetical protein
LRRIQKDRLMVERKIEAIRQHSLMARRATLDVGHHEPHAGRILRMG